MGLRDPDDLKRTLDHSFGCISEAVHDPVGKGAVVGADAQGSSKFFAAENQWTDFLIELLKCLLIVGFRVGFDLEAFGVGVVSGVDSDLLDMFGCFEGGLWEKMNVGHEGLIEAIRAEFPADIG
ncbi:MAG: hypothetical protein BWY82_02524 [Verrucomicrobia bacterium ADurb.Bin474]|nr:MAG: hypothetical protein BWY82_02524 [Verrucomicrobia bacterium ADurb.Bin474]